MNFFVIILLLDFGPLFAQNGVSMPKLRLEPTGTANPYSAPYSTQFDSNSNQQVSAQIIQSPQQFSMFSGENRCSPSTFQKRAQMSLTNSESWQWQLLPTGLLFPNFLAGVNESRLGGVWNHEKNLGWIWDISLGGHAPILRYGTKNSLLPEGFQLDVEGAVHLRLDLEHERDMDANDFHFGIPLTFATQNWQMKFGYHHVSSHLGDERMIRLEQLGVPHNRINYYRESLRWGVAYKPTSSTRIYGEVDLAVDFGEETKPWHFQFGAEYAPQYPVAGSFRGSPFAAIHTRLMQERNFDGSLCLQFGWQWKGSANQAFRLGFQYYTGVSEQFEYIVSGRENKFGFGFWYDF
ncbi:MAG: DUF1207 domain-containing protein [Thermoguttaceae bacterium]